MAAQYDLVIIGTGVAGATAAHICREAGWRVAIIDHLPFGGTCALRGCDPKKVLVGVAEAQDLARRLRGKGLAGGEPRIDWREMIAFERSFTEPQPARREEDFAEAGIDAFHGHARFRDAKTIEVNGEALEARFVLLAVGARPMRLGMEGEEHLATSDDFLALDALPERIAFIGGGFIGAECAHIAARAGAKVAILEQGARMLTPFDPDLVDRLIAATRALGVEVRLGAKVTAIEKGADGFAVTLAGDGAPATIEADLVVNTAGRVPDLDALDLEAGNVARRDGRLELDAQLRSVSNRQVFAAGDAASRGPQLTPIASREARMVADAMLGRNEAPPDYDMTPSAIFTIPPLARVGLLEEEARRRNLRFRVKCEDTGGWYTARRVVQECAGFKTLVEEDSGRILGAHLLGPNAEEVINIFAVAMRAGVPADRLKNGIFAYPTAGSDIGYML
jgi:glutathione reductase (NADPH)